MSNLRAIKTKPEPNPEVIDLLRRFLARAEAGEIRGVVIVCETATGDTDWESSCLEYTPAVVGSLVALVQDLASDMLEGE